MHLGQISLCGTLAYNIKSDEDKAKILAELDAFEVRVIKRHYETFDASRHVSIINTSPFLVSVRTNGNPYYLYLTRTNQVNQCLLIDKKVQQGYFYPRMILTRLLFDDEMFDNTLFEGEMVRDNRGDWAFVINDMLVYRGCPQNALNLVKRVNAVGDILRHKFVADDMDVCELQVKKYFSCGELHKVVHEFIPSLPYSCRGLYFKPFFLKFRDILMNFDDSLIKRIVRTRYKDTSNFLLMSDRQRLQESVQDKEPEPEQEPEKEEEEEEEEEGTHAPTLSPPDESLNKSVVRRASFFVRHTSLPDVYELYESAVDVGKGPSHALIANVPSLACSRTLRSTFTGRGVTDTVLMTCEYCPRFEKWTPLYACTDTRAVT
jgi:hypothetical protein